MALLVSTNVSGSLNVTANIANTGNLLVTQNTFTGNMNIAGICNIGNGTAAYGFLNVTQNIANVGNLLVTQNTFTGNLSVTTLTNVVTINVKTTANVATLNVLGVLSANATPIINLSTRAMTALTCNLTANAQTANFTNTTNILSCTFNEQGMYSIYGMIFYGHYNASGQGANAANIGMNIAFGNSGTATVSSIKYAAHGRANGATIFSNLITTTAQSTIIPNTSGTIANSTNNTDYLVLTGYLNVSAVGTINIQIASVNSANANLNVSTNTYIVYTKIG
jgi:hypothetical protein